MKPVRSSIAIGMKRTAAPGAAARSRAQSPGASPSAPHHAAASLRQIATRAVYRARHGSADGVRDVDDSQAPVAAHESPATYAAVDAFELPLSGPGPVGERV